MLKLFIIFQLMKTLLLVGVAKITGDNERKQKNYRLVELEGDFPQEMEQKVSPLKRQGIGLRSSL